MNSGSDGAGAAVEVGGSGRITGAESEGRLSSVTTSGLEVEVISPAVETAGETVVETVVETLQCDESERWAVTRAWEPADVEQIKQILLLHYGLSS